jgi:hypothetical protein
MLAKEMHIEFSLGFQKLGANSRRKFYPEEIDALLNRAVGFFIEDQIKETEDKEGFQNIQIDVDKIRPLIVRGLTVNAEKQAALGSYKAILPGDYAYMISSTWNSAKNCATITSASQTRNYFVMQFTDSTKGSAPYYATASIAQGGTTLVSLAADIPQSKYTGYPAVADKFSVINLLREVFYEKKRRGTIASGYELYFERMGNLYIPGALILVSPVSTDVTFTIDSTISTITASSTSYNQQASSSYTGVTARQIKSSVLDNVLGTPFIGPLKHSPVSAIIGNEIEVHSHSSCIVNTGSLTYIRKPSRISLSLQRNCELAPEFHQSIVDKAVEFAAGRVEQQGLYQVTETENKRNQ